MEDDGSLQYFAVEKYQYRVYGSQRAQWHLPQRVRHANDGLSTECMNTPGCAPYKHHYEECAERVTKQIEEDGKASEDCVEECKSTLVLVRTCKTMPFYTDDLT